MNKLRNRVLSMIIFLAFSVGMASAQCSICTKTSMQQGEKPARGMNSGIVYLMLTPFAVMGYLGYRWYKNQGAEG